MTLQIAVRLSDEQVAYLDAQIARGRAASRADALRQALQRAERAEREAADVAAYLATDEDAELDDFHRVANAAPMID